MNIPTPTHETVAQRAYSLWQQAGCPDGRDTEFWLEAEHQLGTESPATSSPPDAATAQAAPVSAGAKSQRDFAQRVKSETAAESNVENHLSPALPDEEAIQAALQKKDARAPIVPHHTGPKTKPAETGKPLWSRPHSS
jgi:DUF2934 family protein